MAATGREVISAVADKLGTTDELLLVHLSSAGGKNIDLFISERADSCNISNRQMSRKLLGHVYWI